MLLSNSYIVTEDFVQSVQDNIDLLEYPAPFRDFLTYVSLIDGNIKTGLRRMELQVDNPYFSQWIDALVMAQDDRSMSRVALFSIFARCSSHANESGTYVRGILTVKIPKNADISWITKNYDFISNPKAGETRDIDVEIHEKKCGNGAFQTDRVGTGGRTQALCPKNNRDAPWTFVRAASPSLLSVFSALRRVLA